MNTEHLPFPDEGWGYLPPTDDVIRAFQFARYHYDPKRVLEIGFHLGHSTTYQLETYNKKSHLVSVSPFIDRTGVHKGDFIDPTLRWKMACTLYDKYKPRWVWIPGKSHMVRQEIDAYHEAAPFDFALVDGGHTYEPASYDMQMCVDFGMKAFLLDNFELQPVRNAFNDNPRLKLRKRFFYEQTFKGRTKKNQLAVIEILPEGVDIDTRV